GWLVSARWGAVSGMSRSPQLDDILALLGTQLFDQRQTLRWGHLERVDHGVRSRGLGHGDVVDDTPCRVHDAYGVAVLDVGEEPGAVLAANLGERGTQGAHPVGCVDRHAVLERLAVGGWDLHQKPHSASRLFEE